MQGEGVKSAKLAQNVLPTSPYLFMYLCERQDDITFIFNQVHHHCSGKDCPRSIEQLKRRMLRATEQEKRRNPITWLLDPSTE